MWLDYSLIFSFVILACLGIWIYLIQKNIAYKFYFPAIVLFVLFSLVPISYSVYVSFTNLKTGHLLDREHIVQLFLDETVYDSEKPTTEFQLFKKNDHYFIKTHDLVGELTTTAKVIKLKTLSELENNSVPVLSENKNDTFNLSNDFFTNLNNELSTAEVYDFITSHANLVFIHPELGELKFFRTNQLAHLTQRYQLKKTGELYDNLLQTTLTEDTANGQFELAGEAIGPGYYTTVGLKNYKDLLYDSEISSVFFKTFGWTFAWAFISVALCFSLGTLIAILLNELNEKVKLIYRLLFIIPYSIPFFISVLIFKGMLNKDFGEINHLLSYLHIAPIPWLDHKYWARISVLMVNLWLGYPYMLLVVTGILQSIPKSIYEASALEGASRLQNFRYLTFPLVMKAMVPLLIGSFAFNLNNFVGIYLLTGGGPAIANTTTQLGETDILISYTYRLAFEGSQGQNFATAAAVSMFIFLIVVVITLINFRVSKKLTAK